MYPSIKSLKASLNGEPDVCMAGLEALSEGSNGNALPAEFVETICIEHGKACNLKYHNLRMNRTRRAFWGDALADLKLEDFIQPEGHEERTRCRVVYGREIKKVEYFLYQLREVNSLKCVVCDEADYTYKSTDRSLLTRLFAERGEADDTLIIRNGRVTDTTIANVAFGDGTGWYTPAGPLLKGTRRQSLLEEGKIHERDISVEEIHRYQRIRLFNAMIPFGRIEFSTEKIVG